MSTRREILALGAAALGLLRARGLFAGIAPARKPLDILILGGTGFLGPHQVEYALARGHRLTLFNRGHKDVAALYGGRVEVLIGDRDSRTAPGLAALEGARRFDAVIDNSGYIPRHVRESAELLKGRVGRYLFVSTVAAYEGAQATCVESSPLRPLPNPEDERLTFGRYGPFKAEGDRIVRAVYGAAATVVRPTYIVGPGDETDRFTYWAARTAEGGAVVGPRADAVDLQVMDVRDLCPWLITLLERDVSGVFNAASPSMAWDKVLEALRPLSAGAVSFVRPPAALIEELKIDFPLVLPSPMGKFFGNDRTRFDGRRALKAGLSYRPVADSGRATLEWWRAQSEERRSSGATRWPTAEQEKTILARMAAG